MFGSRFQSLRSDGELTFALVGVYFKAVKLKETCPSCLRLPSAHAPFHTDRQDKPRASRPNKSPLYFPSGTWKPFRMQISTEESDSQISRRPTSDTGTEGNATMALCDQKKLEASESFETILNYLFVQVTGSL